ncbi:MAG TPA: MFS transporter [Aggregatilinea sp.]|uniref:MFS transporter n=1 Tax=Aggregatilinea sp. TaxID=2806333 RepID=UPI002C13241C|nr:MFS transporter [Aggregatilinea sp.]HML20440.1 MFS transporter [Aggregatilinea sp.]
MTISRSSNRQLSPWWILAIVSLPVFIGALDLTIISAVLPEVIVSLKLPVKDYLDQASWAVNGYLLAYALSMTFTGRLSDLIGRRAVYIVCLILFMIGSYLVTAYDSTFLNSLIARFYNSVLGMRPPRLEERHLYLVIAARIVQALGAGAMVPITIALVGDLFPRGERARPLGVVGAVDTVGWGLGHLYGGVMVRFFGLHGDSIVNAFDSLGISVSHPSWETLFILNIPISVIGLFGAWWALRSVAGPRATGRFDIIGTLLFSASLIALNLGLGASPEAAMGAGNINELQEASSGRGVYFLLAALAFFLLFLWMETRVRDPLVHLRLFTRRNFASASGTNLLVGFCLAIGLVSAPLLVNIRAESPTSDDIQQAAYIAGLLLSGLTIPMALAALPGSWLSDRRGYRFPTVLGMSLAAVGFVLAGLTWKADTSYWIMGAEMVLVGIGLGLTISPIGTAVINDVNEDERGVASALVLILRLIGMTLAISSLTTYSLARVDQLVRDQGTSTPSNDTGEVIEASVDAQFYAAVQAIQELQYVGALVSVLGLLAAAFLQGGRVLSLRAEPPPPTGEDRRAMARGDPAD